MKAVCPKCGWKTRELGDEELEWVAKGRMRCSGKCQEGAVPNQPLSFPPKLIVEPEPAPEVTELGRKKGGK